MARWLTAVIALGIVGSAPGPARAQDKVALAFTAKAGQADRYKVEVVLTADNAGRRQTYDSRENRKITVAGVSASGDVTLEFETESVDVFVNGIPQQMKPGQGTTGKYSIIVRPDLSLVDYKGPRPKGSENLDTRLYRAITPAFTDRPVGARDTWVQVFQANRALGTRAARGDYEVQGFEKVRGVDCVKIKWLYEEDGADPITASAVAWIDRATGTMVKVEATIDNVPADAAGTPAKGKIKHERSGK